MTFVLWANNDHQMLVVPPDPIMLFIWIDRDFKVMINRPPKGGHYLL